MWKTWLGAVSLAIAGLAMLGVAGCDGGHDEREEVQQLESTETAAPMLVGCPWRSLHGPSPGDIGPLGTILALAIDPERPRVVYAAVRSLGVFKTSDGGRHWQATNTGLPETAHGPYGVHGLSLDASRPTTLYAGYSGGASGVFKTTDGGRHWRTFGREVVGEIVALAIDPKIPTNVYAAGYRGVSKSTDGGRTWRSLNAGTSGDAVAIDPGRPETVYVGGGVHKTTDGGRTWRPAGTGLPQDGWPVGALAIDPLSPETIYAGFNHGLAEWEHGGVFKSTDGGQTWRSVNTGLPAVSGSPSAYAFAIDPTQRGVIYVAALNGSGYLDGGVFRSTDAGETWHDFSRGLIDPIHPNAPDNAPGTVNALAIDANGRVLYAGTDIGVFECRLPR